MSQYKYAEVADTVYFWFAANTTAGAAGDGATPLYDVRLAGALANAAPTAGGTPTLLTHADYADGLHEIAIDTTGYAPGEYAVFCTLTISTVNPAGFCGSFKLRTAGTSAIDANPDSSGVTELLTRVADAPAGAAPTLALTTNTVHADAGNTASVFRTHLTEADDYWNDALILITSGALAGQVKEIGDFANTNGVITLTSGQAFTGIPADNVTFAIINR